MISANRRTQPVLTIVVLTASLIAALTSCSRSGNTASAAPPALDTTTSVGPVAAETASNVVVTASPTPNSTGVEAGGLIIVTTTGATIDDISVMDGIEEVDGEFSYGGARWASAAGTAPATTYSISVEMTGVDGGHISRSWTFTTAEATGDPFRTTIMPTDGQVVGVGMPVIVRLSKSIDEAKRADLLKRLDVTSTPAVEGAWRWMSPTELHWRPAEYWPSGTKVSVTSAIKGFNAGDGAWGAADVNVSYSIGDAHISTVDTQTHMMTITVNGEVVKEIPVSTGQAKYPTRSGIHVINEKNSSLIMDSATVGIPKGSPDYYRLDVKWAVRISNSGEFVHAAPWSVASQGKANVSHGCVNVSTENGQWFFEFSQIGDVVNVINSPVQLQPTNGLGDWQIPWAEWAN